MIFLEPLRRQSTRILSLIDSAEQTFEEGDELRSHMAKYICILCSGFLENVVHLVYGEYVRRETSSLSVISYISVMLNKVQNPNTDRFKEIARSFKHEWEAPLNTFLQEEEKSAALNYIIRERHKIAHGKDSDITLARIREYHLKTVQVVEFIEHQCNLIPVAAEPVVPVVAAADDVAAEPVVPVVAAASDVAAEPVVPVAAAADDVAAEPVVPVVAAANDVAAEPTPPKNSQ